VAGHVRARVRGSPGVLKNDVRLLAVARWNG